MTTDTDMDGAWPLPGSAEFRGTVTPRIELLGPEPEEARPVVFDLIAHLQRQIDFSERTFGPGPRVAGVCDHIRKELREVQDDAGAGLSTLSEWIDVIILAFDGAWRSGATPKQIVDAIVAKQTKNEGRRWPDWRTADPEKAIEHDRSADAAAAPSAAEG